MIDHRSRHLALTLAIVLSQPLAAAGDAGHDASTHGSRQHAAAAPHASDGYQHAVHDLHPVPKAQPSLSGQYAFATIAEIVDLLTRDPSTDWSQVDLESLRQHLIDMDRVTLGARVTSEDIPGGARFTVTSGHADTVASIRRMTRAHAATTDHAATGTAWRYTFEAHPEGATLAVEGDDPATSARIRALGFIGILVAGTHHPVHHLAIARGEQPHEH